MDASPKHSRRRINSLDLIIGVVGVGLAIVSLIFNIPLFPIALILGVLTLGLLALSPFIATRAQFLETRNENLNRQMVIDGVQEREVTELLSGFRGIASDYKDMRRRLGQIPDSGDRARLFLEITASETGIHQQIESVQELLISVRELRQSMMKTNRKQQQLATEIDRLRRQTSIVYNARRSLQDAIELSRRDDAKVKEIEPRRAR